MSGLWLGMTLINEQQKDGLTRDVQNLLTILDTMSKFEESGYRHNLDLLIIMQK